MLRGPAPTMSQPRTQYSWKRCRQFSVTTCSFSTAVSSPAGFAASSPAMSSSDG